MNLRDVIIAGSSINENLVLYAKRIDGKLLPWSEIILLELTEEEQTMGTDEVEKRKCPGFSYCMEMFLIQELLRDLDALTEKIDMDKKIDRVIYHIEYDA
jgi:hypothetical protein